MIEEQAVVVAREGEYAWVERERQSACGSCAVNKGCGTSVLAQVVGRRYSRLKVLNSIHAELGEEVVLGLDERALVRGSFAVYLLPLLALFAFGLLGDTLAVQLGVQAVDAVVAGFALGGLLLGLAWLRRYSRALARDARYQPIIMRRAAARPPISVTQATKDLQSL